MGESREFWGLWEFRELRVMGIKKVFNFGSSPIFRTMDIELIIK